MHNWWIATLEHAGIITREEAKKLSDEIKTRIHKEDYGSAYREIENILKQKESSTMDSIHKDIEILKHKISELSTPKK